MELPLRLQLKPSRSYLMFLAGGHILAGVAVCLLPVPNLLRLGLVLLLGLLLLRQWHAVSRDLPSLLLRRDGKVEVQNGAAAPVSSAVGANTITWSCLVVLHLRSEEGSARSLILFPDSLKGSDAHRQLRLWLRWSVDRQMG